MLGINKLKQQLIKNRNENFVPITEAPLAVEYVKFKSHDEYPRSSARYRDLKYLNNDELIDPTINKYFYNACICDADNGGYRVFYRVGKEPKGYEDRVATCLLDKDLNIIQSSNIYLNLYSNWEESVTSFSLKLIIPFKFKNGTHVEDPRAVFFNNHWFVFYTDGARIGVAKITKDCSKTIYSHYLKPISNKSYHDYDGREKNWIPFISGNKLYILYSDNPRTIFTCNDNLDSLDLLSSHTHSKIFTWKYGNIRGGAPPVKYDDHHLLWIFHSQKLYPTHVGNRIVYMFGAYISKNTFPFEFKKIVSSPILVGIPCEISETKSIKDCIVFPCGCVNLEKGWRVSLGVNDYEIGFIDISEKDLFWEESIPTPIYKRLSKN